MRAETRFRLNISPLRAWSMLSNLPSFAAWHPTYQFCGAARSAGETVKLRWRITKSKTTIIDADIIELEKPHIIAWQTGVSGIIAYRERYEIVPGSIGVEILHQSEWCGILGRIIGLFTVGSLSRMMAVQDRALLAYLKKEARSASIPNRHKRRATVARGRRSAVND
jgi:hypothetical protein